MNKRGGVATALVTGAMLTLPVTGVAVCIAILASTMVVKGVVVSPNFSGVVGCKGDNGWPGVIGQPFVQIGGTAADPNDVPSIFFAGHHSPLDTFYIGIHVPYDPDMRRQDHLTLYFDANNDSAWNVGDFALVYDVGQDVTINSGEECEKTPGQVQLFRYTGNLSDPWGSGSDAPPAITSMFAFDYDDTDPETQLWELEIGIDRAQLALAGLNLSTAGFRVGAKLYPHQFGVSDEWQTWIWPADLTTESSPELIFPADGNVTAQKLAPIRFNSCADVVIDAISGTNPSGQNNTFRRPQPGDWVNGVLPADKQNHFTASLRFFNPSNPADQSPLANTGAVDFMIRPFGNGEFLNERLMHTEQVNFTALSQTYDIAFPWPVQQTEYAPIANDMQVSQHSCLKVVAKNFTLNLNPGSDVRYRNLTYTSLSTRVDTFAVSTRVPQFLETTQSIAFLMHAHWKNLPKSATGWDFKITSADRIPLKDAGNGYYTFTMDARQDRRFQVEMTGGSMPIKSLKLSLDPRMGGAVTTTGDGLSPLTMPVKEGQHITIVAQGHVRVLTDSLFNGANGRTEREFTNQPFLLRNGLTAPMRHIGAVIGSFDGFKTSFVIGADRSFVVPRGATALAFAVNDVIGQYKDNRDGAFMLFVFITEPHRLPMQYVAPGIPGAGQPAMGDQAANLPQLDIDVFQNVVVKPPQVGLPPPGGVTQPGTSSGTAGVTLIRPYSYVTFAVYETHGGSPCGCGGCPAHGTASLGVFFGSSALGLVLVRRRVHKKRRGD